MAYVRLRCPCTSRRFRVSGWPRVVSGAGGFFWQTVTRVWREARERTLDGEAMDSPFALPLLLECADCDRKGELASEAASGTSRFAPGESQRVASPRSTREARPSPPCPQSRPREAYRCRVCRRSVVEVVLGCTRADPGVPRSQAESLELRFVAGAAIEVVARCVACRREGRIAWLDDRPSSQQVRLDLLYGRR